MVGGGGQTAALCSPLPLEAIFVRPREGQQDSPVQGGVDKETERSGPWAAGSSVRSFRKELGYTFFFQP